MFRNDAQKCLAIRALLGPHLDYLWTTEGPTPTAITLLERRGGPMSHGEQLMLFCAFDIWNGDGKALLGSLIAVLDGDNLRRLGTLLVAMSGLYADRAIDRWIEEHTRPAKTP